MVQGKQVELTTSDIADALKCNDEHPPEDAQLNEQPESFYTSEIIEDMCVGQYVVDKRNAVSQSKLPPQLWLMDSILQRMCAHWDTRRKGVKDIGIPSHQSFGIKFTSFGIRYMHAEPPL